MTARRRAVLLASIVLTPLLLVAAFLLLASGGAVNASSHREAPAISKDQFADNTDVYIFIPEGVTDRVVLAANWQPFQFPEGGPNFYEWDDDVTYSIHIDNDGDAVADYTYSLNSETTIRNPFDTFLYNTGPITDISSPNWNRPQTITVTESVNGAAGTPLIADELTAPVNIGSKSTPDYPSLVAQATYTVASPEGDILIYGGQADDTFFVDFSAFDLLTLRGQDAPVGYSTGNNDPVNGLAGYNVHSLVLEMPVTHLTEGSETVLGIWATASRGGMNVMGNAPAGAATQVSRLGMPFVNELVIPMGAKDIFNTLRPDQDLGVYTAAAPSPFEGLLQEAVENPELGTLLCGLYGVPMPDDANDDCNSDYTAGTPRTSRQDIFDIFLRGFVLDEPFTITTASGATPLPAGFNVNQPAGVQPAEMIRFNTAIAGDLCSPTASRLGVLGGDACGFPNGRRLTDDIVEIELLAVAGAAYDVISTQEDDSFTFNPAFAGVLTDGIDENDRDMLPDFPYVPYAQSGQAHIHDNPTDMPTSLSFGNITLEQGSAPWLQIAALAASVGLIGGLEWMRRRVRR